MADPGLFLSWAWRIAPKLPEPFVRGLLRTVADVTWLLNGVGVQRLQGNLARVRPLATKSQLRRLARSGLRSYLRYYGEILVQPGLEPQVLAARVRTVNMEWLQEEFADGRVVVAALGHSGNWDLAGAWMATQVVPLTTVAERLKPDRVFEDFLRLRQLYGIEIVPVSKEESGKVFQTLQTCCAQGPRLIPLLADRDLSRRGVEVELFGEKARAAAGPAALAYREGRPLCFIAIRYERLRGYRRRVARSPWGIVLEYSDPITVPTDAVDPVAELTQAWVRHLERAIDINPQDWHMLQLVFVSDLDPARTGR